MRYENTSDAERRHHHPGGHGHGPGFGGFGRGGGHRRGRGRGFGRPGGWQQADLPPTDDLTAWLTGRLPDDWFTGAPQVTVDREEITVIGELPAPAAAPEGGDGASAEGRISLFREETREKRMQIADEAEARYGRKVAWGASIGDTTLLFTHLSVPVMTRLRPTVSSTNSRSWNCSSVTSPTGPCATGCWSTIQRGFSASADRHHAGR
jgi:hypothetical protein